MTGKKWLQSYLSPWNQKAVRRAVLGYLRAILLRKNSAKAFLIGQHFLKNYYDSGNAGLAF